MNYRFEFSKREWYAIYLSAFLAIAPIFFMVYETVGVTITPTPTQEVKKCSAKVKEVRPCPLTKACG